jgi:hypothetical protein
MTLHIWGVNWADAITAFATGILAVGVLFAARSLKETAKSRHVTVYAEISRRWDGDDLLNVRCKIGEMSSDELFDHFQAVKGTRESFELDRLANFFEDLGILESLSCLDIRWIDKSLGASVIYYWNMWDRTMKDSRDKDATIAPDSELLYENWGALVNKVSALDKVRATRAHEGAHVLPVLAAFFAHCLIYLSR